MHITRQHITAFGEEGGKSMELFSSYCCIAYCILLGGKSNQKNHNMDSDHQTVVYFPLINDKMLQLGNCVL